LYPLKLQKDNTILTEVKHIPCLLAFATPLIADFLNSISAAPQAAL
jgi:hypothetical protein